MGTVIKMRRLRDGMKLTSQAVRALHELLLDGLLSKRKASNVPRNFKAANETSVNQYNVARDQIWEALDPKDVVDGNPRQLLINTVGDTHAIVTNLRTGSQSAIALSRFSGRTKKSFKLVVPVRQAPFTVARA